MINRLCLGVLLLVMAVGAPAPRAVGEPPPRTSRAIDRTEYIDRLHAMWLGQCIANWTGLRTEGHRTEPPFYTDADWGTIPPGATLPIDFVLDQDPWLADDDTDVEYVYLHLMNQHSRPQLDGARIRAGWLAHMDPQFIWVSNLRAWTLMHRGVTPPATSFLAANEFALHIDAQLTTEFFGALAPGMPERALILAADPIRTTAAGYAAHAAEFYVVLYSLALEVDPALPGRERALRLVSEARRWIPDTSKTAAAVDLVVADFLANPDPDDWERTRDLVYLTFQQNAAGNGYVYRGWTESTVNFATGIIALLYGACDYKRTVQIGTLSGWDSDNPTATMGGLIGLMLGMDGLRAQFPGQVFSDWFDILRTRNNLPDYRPHDPFAQDTLRMMAVRMHGLIDQTVREAGGLVDKGSDKWLLPLRITSGHLSFVPGVRLQEACANNRIAAAGGVVQGLSSIGGAPPSPPWIHGTGNPQQIANGFEHDWRGREPLGAEPYFFSTRGAVVPPGAEVVLTVLYDRPAPVRCIRFIEGEHFGELGGWFESARVEARIGGEWVRIETLPSEALDAQRPFQIIDWRLPVTIEATGIRIIGEPGGKERFVTCLELTAFSALPDSLTGSRR